MSKKNPKQLIEERNPFKRPKIEPADLYAMPPQVKEKTSEPVSAPLALVSSQGLQDDPVKPYSTYLRAGLIEGIKLRAFKRRVKDRQVVETALEEYFTNHPIE